MSKFIMCDRCGKKEEGNRLIVVAYSITIRRSYVEYDYTVTQGFDDLCAACKQEIYEWAMESKSV